MDRNAKPNRKEKQMTQTGRSAAGNLRNFRAMTAQKLEDTTREVIRESNDSEALFELALLHNGLLANALVALGRTAQALGL